MKNSDTASNGTSNKMVAIILSGCGNCDGSELQESLSLMLAFDRRGWSYQCFAPEGPYNVFDHRTGKPNGEQRDILEEASRIARGKILPLSALDMKEYDILAIPGGMGAARNLSDYAEKGAAMSVRPDVEQAILDAYRQHKPIVAVCIAPMLLAKVLGAQHITLTLGHTCQASQIAEALGAVHQCCEPRECCIDSRNGIYTAPAYMVGTRISEIFDGSENLVAQLPV